MNVVRFQNAGYPVSKSLVDDLYKSFFVNDRHAGRCKHIPANLMESENDFRIELAVPGFSKEDVKISFHGDVLVIKSDKEVKEMEGVNYLRKDFVPAGFKKKFILNEQVDTEKISAAFNNGILEIVLPKKMKEPEKSAVEIEIK
ncbi:MAG: Hsp20/alpha crystallin family protein [Prolixibacteraceae bacterium]|nr:Hsp20/alpha crystallin family protein [Prolixibacteraceae bacterium]